MKRYLLVRCGLASLALLGACDSYARTNPLDPGYGLEVSLVGPDTIYSINDTVRFELVTQPSHPDLPFVWTTSAATRLLAVAGAPGSFTSLTDGTAVITAEYGPHKVQKEVVVSQRPVRLGIAPPTATVLESLGEVAIFTAAVVDAKNTPVSGATRELQWASSDPSVADVANGRVTARANGSVWVRAASVGLADSVRVQVRQKPATMQYGSAAYTISRPGGAVQTVLLVRDARNNLIASPDGLELRSSRGSFRVDAGGLVQSTAYGSTQITARLGSLEATTLVRVDGGTAPELSRLTAGLTRIDSPAAPASFLLVELTAVDAERDLDEAVVDVYSTGNTFMTQRLVAIEQGTSTAAVFLALPDMRDAGTARVRVRDAALNLSRQTNATVVAQPLPGSPQATIGRVDRVSADSIEVTATVTDAEGDARNLYLVGFDAAGAVVFTRSRSLPAGATSGTYGIGTRTTAGAAVARVGVLVSDAQANLSLVRTATVSASIAGTSIRSAGSSVDRSIASTGGSR